MANTLILCRDIIGQTRSGWPGVITVRKISRQLSSTVETIRWPRPAAADVLEFWQTGTGDFCITRRRAAMRFRRFPDPTRQCRNRIACREIPTQGKAASAARAGRIPISSLRSKVTAVTEHLMTLFRQLETG